MKNEYKILLVEDNEGDVRIIRELLKEQSFISFILSSAGSLSEAKDMLAKQNFDTILLDLGLPDSDGFETFDQLNKLYPLLNAIIILTGLNDTETGLKAVNQGAQDYIIKGQIDSDKLVKSIIYSNERNQLSNKLKEELAARKKAEEEAKRLNRMLVVLSNVNQAIVRIKDRKSLVDNVCTNLVETGNFHHVMIEVNDYPEILQECFEDNTILPADEIKQFIDPLKVKVIESKTKIIINDFRTRGEEVSLSGEYKKDAGSLAILPLYIGDRTIGTIAMVSKSPDFFDDDELALLTEIADDISFAFSTFNEAEQKLKSEAELELNRITAQTLYDLSQKTDVPENDLVMLSLKMAKKVTKSKNGYVHFMNEEKNSPSLFKGQAETLKGQSISNGKQDIDAESAIWSESAQTGKPVIHNDNLNDAAPISPQKEHTPLKRYMSVPIFETNKQVVIAVVENKETPYIESDAVQLQLIMNEMWKILARNRMIHELDHSTQKLNLIASRTSAVMYQRGLDSELFEYIHPAIEALTGYNADKLDKVGFKNLIRKIENIHGESVEISVLDDLWNEKKSNEYNMDYLIETKDKELKWLNDKSYPLLNKDGVLDGIIGILMDISSHKEAEIEIVSQKKKSDQLFSNSPVAIVQLDNKSIILKVNASFEKIFGYTKTEAIGENLDLLLVPPELMDEASNFYQQTLKGHSVSETSIRKRKNGSIVYVSLAGVPINTNNEISGYYAMYADITKQKLAEEALIKARDKAEESDRLKTAFLHNISHEIRTPMNAIVGFSALLADQSYPEKTRQSFIETIIQSSDHLLAIISDIVEISNIEANVLKILANEVDLHSIFQTITETTRLKIKNKNIILTISEPLPGSFPVFITDSTKLYQILSNLVNNAIKFTQTGTVEIGYLQKEKIVEFFVSDTGIGIPTEQLEQIFERFYQVDSSDSMQYQGTGLGLSIAKAYVELLGGKIWVTSEPGVGSKFCFILPLDTTSKIKFIAAKPKTPVKKINTGRIKILVAEDIESNFKLIRYYLSSFNADIISASNGKEALDVIKSVPDIDLVLMDLKMPVMDGYTAVKLIREINPLVPVIAQTAYADDGAKALEIGCNNFISKPFDKSTLLEAIKEYLP